MKRPDYRTLQALDAVIRERGFERAAQKLCITQSAVSQRIKQLENMFGQPLLVRTVPPRPTEQGQKLLALLRQVELLEDEWLGDEQTGSTPLLLSLAVNADSLATWLLPALAPVLANIFQGQRHIIGFDGGDGDFGGRHGRRAIGFVLAGGQRQRG